MKSAVKDRRVDLSVFVKNSAGHLKTPAQCDIFYINIAEKGKNSTVTRHYLEVDFICNLGSSRVYIQSAYSIPDEEKRAQETRSFRRIDDSFKKIIVTREPAQPWYDDNGILTVSIYDFLLERTIIEK